jgi:hypothetical protein
MTPSHNFRLKIPEAVFAKKLTLMIYVQYEGRPDLWKHLKVHKADIPAIKAKIAALT